METKKAKGEKKADFELRKFSVELAVYLGPDFSIAKADEIYRYLKTGVVAKPHIVGKPAVAAKK